ERFDLHYTTPDGAEARPVMIHRAMLGSIERFMAILIEHCAGSFPFWLAPVQVRVLPITDRVTPHAEKIAGALREADLRAETEADATVSGPRTAHPRKEGKSQR